MAIQKATEFVAGEKIDVKQDIEEKLELEAIMNSNWHGFYRLHFDPTDASMAMQLLTSMTRFDRMLPTLEGSALDKDSDKLPDDFDLDYKAWLTPLKTSTITFLSSSEAKSKLRVNNGYPTTGLSQLLELWSKTTGREVVEEIDIYRDNLNIIVGFNLATSRVTK